MYLKDLVRDLEWPEDAVCVVQDRDQTVKYLPTMPVRSPLFGATEVSPDAEGSWWYSCGFPHVSCSDQNAVKVLYTNILSDDWDTAIIRQQDLEDQKIPEDHWERGLPPAGTDCMFTHPGLNEWVNCHVVGYHDGFVYCQTEHHLFDDTKGIARLYIDNELEFMSFQNTDGIYKESISKIIRRSLEDSDSPEKIAGKIVTYLKSL